MAKMGANKGRLGHLIGNFAGRSVVRAWALSLSFLFFFSRGER